jgi:hypothetical protein
MLPWQVEPQAVLLHQVCWDLIKPLPLLLPMWYRLTSVLRQPLWLMLLLLLLLILLLL